jgi:hypothetical protein
LGLMPTHQSTFWATTTGRQQADLRGLHHPCKPSRCALPSPYLVAGYSLACDYLLCTFLTPSCYHPGTFSLPCHHLLKTLWHDIVRGKLLSSERNDSVVIITSSDCSNPRMCTHLGTDCHSQLVMRIITVIVTHYVCCSSFYLYGTVECVFQSEC